MSKFMINNCSISIELFKWYIKYEKSLACSYSYTFREHSSLPLDSDGQNILTIFKRKRKREREREKTGERQISTLTHGQ